MSHRHFASHRVGASCDVPRNWPRMAVIAALVAGLGGVGLTAGAQDQTRPALDATLESVSGGNRTISAERGRRVIVLFYEDRNHLSTNEAFKGNLRRFIDDNHLGNRVVTIGVANLLRMPRSVPRSLVRSMIRPLVSEWSVDILLDWDGVMRTDPWPMQGNTSNVAILDKQSRLIWHTTGALSQQQTTQFYRTLRRAMRAE